MKGQLFISDVLASILIVTIIVAFTTWEFEQIYSRASDMEYEKINFIAQDTAQMAVKSILANVSEGKILPNWINASRWDLLATNMSSMIKPPYAYDATIKNTGLSLSGNGGCNLKLNVAAARRVVYIDGAAQEFNVRVCV